MTSLKDYIKKVLLECEPGEVEFDIGVEPTISSLEPITVNGDSKNRIKFTIVKGEK